MDAVYAMSKGLGKSHHGKLTFDNITNEEAELLVARLGGVSICFHTLRFVRKMSTCTRSGAERQVSGLGGECC